MIGQAFSPFSKRAADPWPATETSSPRAGFLRRKIALDRIDDRRVIGWVEDDFHHFGVMIEYDAGRITDVRSRAVRYPWNSCVTADAPLRSLIGKPLVNRSTEIGALIDMRAQCTHLFDLAGLVLSHATGGLPSRHYEIIVPDSVTNGVAGTVADNDIQPVSLYRDDRLVMYWRVRDEEIVDPVPYAGHSISRGFRAWTETLEREEAEQASIIRRAMLVATGRKYVGLPLEDMPPVTTVLCHSLRPDLPDGMERLHDTRRECDADGAPMLTLRGEIP